MFFNATSTGVSRVWCYWDCIDGNQGNCTALMLAAEGDHNECIKILLSHGADVNMADNVSVLQFLLYTAVTVLLDG